MHGTTTSVRVPGRFPDAAVAAASLDPAWRPWVRLLEVAHEAADDPVWSRSVPEPAPDRPPNAPLLHATTISVDGTAARRLVRTLLRETEGGGRTAEGGPQVRDSSPPSVRRSGRNDARRLDVLAVLQGAIAQDVGAIERAAEVAGIDAGPLSAIAQLAAVPILHACASTLRDRIPESWLHGYCPVCGAWPALAELRGLERNRRLRCGRCSCDWQLPVLRCPYCDELHHDRLRALLPEGNEQTRRVDVCDTCKGYLKAFSTLTAMPLQTLAMTDLATIELDLVAQERGYERPARAGYAVSVTLRRAGRLRT